MAELETVHRSENARVLLVSMRGVLPALSRCLTFEFEDVAAVIDEVDVVTPAQSLRPSWPKHKLHRLVEKGSCGVWQLPKDGLKPPREYDLILVVAQDLSDLYELGAIDSLLKHGRHSIAFIEEIWHDQLPQRPGELELLAKFDQVANGCYWSVEPLESAIGVPCFYQPPGTDAVAGHPVSLDGPRPIDVYYMGRRSPDTHHALLDWAEERGAFYLHDTYSPGRVYQPREHRKVLTDLIKRSVFFFANKAKADLPEQTFGQEEVGFRFFEGAAGGAVMVGAVPKAPAFGALFGWEDAVIDVPFDCRYIGEVLDDLLAQPERLRAARVRNLRGALERHDWVWRWSRILEAAGMSQSEGVAQRVAHVMAKARSLTEVVKSEVVAAEEALR